MINFLNQKNLKSKGYIYQIFFSGKRNSYLKQSSVSPHSILLLAFINNATLKGKLRPQFN